MYNYNNYKDNMTQKAYLYSKKFGLRIDRGLGHNDEADAFRHAFMQSSLTYKFNKSIAESIGNIHEILGSIKNQQSPEEKNMDLWNNAVGRQIGRELKYQTKNKNYTKEQIDDMLAEKIVQKMRRGEMITNLKDQRSYEFFEETSSISLDKAIKYDPTKPSTPTTPKDFSKLQPAKLDELKNPAVQGISGAMGDTTTTPINIIQPQPINLGQNTTSWLSQLGRVISILGSVVGSVAGLSLNNTGNTGQLGVKINGQSYTGQQFPLKHTGGKISGKDEVLAILHGGETVRTKAQEEELQQEKHKQLMEAIRPYLEQNEKPKTIEQAYDPNNKIPCLLNKTTHDEEIIISIIAQAWKTNRLGLRNVIRYE